MFCWQMSAAHVFLTISPARDKGPEAARGATPPRPNLDREVQVPAWAPGLQPRKQHPGALRIRVVGFRPQLDTQKALLESCFDPEAEYDQHQADQPGDCSSLRGHRRAGGDNAGVDGVPNECVGPRIHNVMVGFARDRARPHSAQMQARPPAEQKPRQREAREAPTQRYWRFPKRELGAEVAIRNKQKGDTGNSQHAIERLGAALGTCFGAIRP